MKTIVIGSVILVIFLLYIGHLSITIKPFSLNLPYWHRSLGVLLWILGLILFNVGEYATGYKKGLDNGAEIGKKVVIEKLKELSGGDKDGN